MLARLVADRNPSFLACADDMDWRPQWRVDLIPSYKTHRTDLPDESPLAIAEDELEHQVPLIFEILDACGVKVVGLPGYEAEDIIGTLAIRTKGRVEIVSGDRDLFQLVRDPDIVVLYPRKGVSDLITVDESYIAEKFGIPGRAYGDYAIMRGDPSDGLPGVVGVGQKTAATLLNKYGCLEAIVEAAMTGPGTGALGRIKVSLDYLDRAVKVVLIPTDLPIPKVDLTRPRAVPGGAIFQFAEKHALLGATKRLVAALTGN